MDIAAWATSIITALKLLILSFLIKLNLNFKYKAVKTQIFKVNAIN